MSIEISSENNRFLDEAVASGDFASRDAAIDRAVSLLRRRQEAIQQILARGVQLPPLPSVLEQRAPGYIAVRGHRIGLHLILERYFAGCSVDELRDWFSSLAPADLDQVLDFVRSHSELMRGYFDQQQQIERLMLDDMRRGPSKDELLARWEKKFGQPFVSPCR